MSTPVLLHPNPTKTFIVEMDASNSTIGAICQQNVAPRGILLVKIQTPNEVNYVVYDKLYAITSTFEEWKPCLVGGQHQVQVAIDHKNIFYCMLNQRHACWSKFLDDWCVSKACQMTLPHIVVLDLSHILGNNLSRSPTSTKLSAIFHPNTQGKSNR